MSTVTSRSEVVARLAPLLKQARGRAARLGRPVLASLTAHLGPSSCYDPSPFAALPDSIVWDQPRRGFAIAAAGHAVRLTASGASRFRDIEAQLKQLLEEAAVEQDSGAALRPAPLAFAGFAFDPAHPDDVAWFGFPEALTVLPRVLVAHSGAHLFTTVSILMDADTDELGVLDDLRTDLERVLSLPDGGSEQERPARLLDPGPDARAYWDESVTGLTERIARGEAEKVVLARRVQVEADGPFDAVAVLRRLRERYPECTIFGVRAGEGACFLGATPETLVAVRGREAHADVLAGSAARGATKAEDDAIGAALLFDGKERREHAIVSRSVSEALAPFCREVRQPAAPGLKRFANVQHLHTPVEGTMGERHHVLELAERLHPTAATAGLPREASLGLIRAHEPFSRGWYAGPLGWIDAEGGGEFAVGLRSALLREEVASLYAGCGIVPGSDPAREYAESQLKLQAMLWALNATAEETS